MTNHNSDKDGSDALVNELKQENEKLRQRVNDLEEKQKALAEMEANYPYFRSFVYAKLREEFADSPDDVPDVDLETLAKMMNAEPIDDLIDQLEKAGGKPG